MVTSNLRPELFFSTPKTSSSSDISQFQFPKVRKLGFCTKRLPTSSRFQFKGFNRSFGSRWKLNEIGPDAVQERLSSWLLKTQNFLNEVTAPLVKTGHGRKPDLENAVPKIETEEIFMVEQTVRSKTPEGIFSLAAIVSIEQFSRLNGLTGMKMQKIFEALAPESLRKDARQLVEYCCFRYLSRDSSDIHPSLKEIAFQKLLFITMLAWEHPYIEDADAIPEHSSLQSKLVGEESFVRIAPAIAGVADRSTAHNLFKSLVGDEPGISLSLWTTYISELLKVHKRRKSYQSQESSQNFSEQVLCIGSSRKQPVLKWENNVAWPGKLTLTDRALYFEAVTLTGHKDAVRLDLTQPGSRVEKSRVGPWGYVFFDSAVSVSSGPDRSKTWVLEFVDFGGEMRRDVWHAFISEVILLYEFKREYGPHDDDPSLQYVYGAHKGKRKAIASASNSIARLLSLQYIPKLSEDPSKLVQFTYLKNAPYGEVVYQTLAVNFWGGPLIRNVDLQTVDAESSSEGHSRSSSSTHVFDIDGSVYLRQWMKSPSWASSTSVAFWKNSPGRQGIILGKNLVVSSMTLVERAALACKEKSQMVEKTQATLDAAMIKGIPSNIDLFKELMLPFTIMAKNFEKLRRWEEPHLTLSFLTLAYTVIFRNLLPYVFPVTLISVAASMLLLKGLKEQGRLGRSFGKVTIRDQPPSNTIQKIVALKEAMADLENYLQKLNITLLKIRTIVLSGQPQVTNEVAVVLFCGASTLLVFPFRYILAFFLLDMFTREFEFRRKMVIKFMTLLNERWATVPAAPVVVLPYESDKSKTEKEKQGKEREKVETSRTQNSENRGSGGKS